jgi:hypothetical protein
MNIPTEIYAGLSPLERIRAAVSAEARKDDAELKTLKDTCPKRTFTMTDPDYSEAMVKLYHLMLGVELQLAECAFDFNLSSRLEGAQKLSLQQSSLESAASIVEAWDKLMAEMGIDPDEIAKNGPPRHFVVKAIIQVADGEAVPELVEIQLSTMREILA